MDLPSELWGLIASCGNLVEDYTIKRICQNAYRGVITYEEIKLPSLTMEEASLYDELMDFNDLSLDLTKVFDSTIKERDSMILLAYMIKKKREKFVLFTAEDKLSQWHVLLDKWKLTYGQYTVSPVDIYQEGNKKDFPIPSPHWDITIFTMYPMYELYPKDTVSITSYLTTSPCIFIVEEYWGENPHVFHEDKNTKKIIVFKNSLRESECIKLSTSVTVTYEL